MSAEPRLTIGLPVHNGERFLAEALDGLLAQTFRDFELIIADNASTDRTAEICHRYAARDERIRHLRQDRNVGAAENHNVLVRMARGELFKWASHDDLYDPELVRRCVEVLDRHPEAVLVSCRSAVVDEHGAVTDPAPDLPVGSDSPRAPERFRGLLYAAGGDDDYGVIRTEVLRRTPLTGSYYHADRTLVAELALHGPFLRVPETLYHRRDLPGRASRQPSVRAWCTTHDPRRANRWRHPVVRLLGEYVWGFAAAIRRAPLDAADRRACYAELARYLVDRTRPVPARRVLTAR